MALKSCHSIGLLNLNIFDGSKEAQNIHLCQGDAKTSEVKLEGLKPDLTPTRLTQTVDFFEIQL